MKYDIYKNSNGEFWFKHGTYISHREAGAAIIRSDGSKHWYKNDKLHREVGPARIGSDGREEYWLKGVKVK